MTGRKRLVIACLVSLGLISLATGLKYTVVPGSFEGRDVESSSISAWLTPDCRAVGANTFNIIPLDDSDPGAFVLDCIRRARITLAASALGLLLSIGGIVFVTKRRSG